MNWIYPKDIRRRSLYKGIVEVFFTQTPDTFSEVAQVASEFIPYVLNKQIKKDQKSFNKE